MNKNVGKEFLLFLYQLKEWCDVSCFRTKNKPQKVEEIVKDTINIFDYIQKESKLPEEVREGARTVVNTLREI